jgi:GNAT superfamily N-acetyltransferase
LSKEFTIRRAVRSDSKEFLKLLTTFANWEHFKPPDTKARTRIINDIFEKKLATLIVAASNKKLLGYALYFYTYSSFAALPTLYLEDIFVLEEARQKGVGKALFKKCADEARNHGCGKMEWAVLTWNQNAIRFYEKEGAKRDDIFVYYLKFESSSSKG